MSSIDVVDHFAARARTYDGSSSWCTDEDLGAALLRLAEPAASDRVLDVACGTGLVSREFLGKVAQVVGVDLTPEMAAQAESRLDQLLLARGESLPFPDGSFDVVVCRQGVQFMTLPDAVREMVRVAAPGGRIVLVHLCAYGASDSDDYFEILRLRNPVRRNFFLPGDVEALLEDAGCETVVGEQYISVEDVDVWSDNGAIPESRREAIRERYRTASQAFLDKHAVQQRDGRLVDHMLFVIASGRKPPG